MKKTFIKTKKLISLFAVMTILAVQFAPVAGAATNFTGTHINKSISAGYRHTAVIKSDGKVVTFGNNLFGKLGDGTVTDSNTPVEVTGITDAVAVAAGVEHTAVVKSDGKVVTFGRNSSGQLGNGSYYSSNTPVEVTGITDAVAVSAGMSHTVVLMSDGKVVTFGSDFYGQLGVGNNTSNTNSNTPVEVTGITDAVAVAAGAYHTAVLKSDGTVVAFGRNSWGQFGNGTTTNSNTPVEVTGITDAVAVAAGTYHTVVLKSDGTVVAFGNNSSGQLGISTNTNIYTPVEITGITDAVAVAAGAYHTAVLKSDGTGVTFGSDSYGQLGVGNNTYNTSSFTPLEITNVTDAVAVAAGTHHTVVIKSDGKVVAFGNNSSGQLGIGTNTNIYTPVEITGILNVADIVKLGDLNGNGMIDINDVTELKNHILGVSTLSTENIDIADVNKDGNVNVLDIVLMLLYANSNSYLWLNSFDAADKLEVLKAVRTDTGLGLSDANNLVNSTPSCIRKDNIGNLQAIKSNIEEAGGVAEIKSFGDQSFPYNGINKKFNCNQ